MAFLKNLRSTFTAPQLSRFRFRLCLTLFLLSVLGVSPKYIDTLRVAVAVGLKLVSNDFNCVIENIFRKMQTREIFSWDGK